MEGDLRVKAPHHDLENIRAAAEEDRFRLGKSRCLDMLFPYLGDFLLCRQFVRAVASSLELEDFMQTVLMKDGGSWDEFGVRISDEIASEFGLQNDRTWYLKVRIVDHSGEELFFVSFHRPEHPLRRVGGLLDP